MYGDEPWVVKDLSQVSEAIVRVPTQERFIGQMVEAMKYFFGKGDDSFSDHFLELPSMTFWQSICLRVAFAPLHVKKKKLIKGRTVGEVILRTCKRRTTQPFSIAHALYCSSSRHIA